MLFRRSASDTRFVAGDSPSRSPSPLPGTARQRRVRARARARAPCSPSMLLERSTLVSEATTVPTLNQNGFESEEEWTRAREERPCAALAPPPNRPRAPLLLLLLLAASRLFFPFFPFPSPPPLLPLLPLLPTVRDCWWRWFTRSVETGPATSSCASVTESSWRRAALHDASTTPRVASAFRESGRFNATSRVSRRPRRPSESAAVRSFAVREPIALERARSAVTYTDTYK